MSRSLLITLLFIQSITSFAQDSGKKIGFEIQPISASHLHFYKPKSQNHQLNGNAAITYEIIKQNHTWILGLNFGITAFEYSNLNWRYGFFIHQSNKLKGIIMHQFGIGINYSTVTISENNFVIINNNITDLGKIRNNHFNPNIEYRVGIALGKSDNFKIQIPLRLELLYPFRDGNNRVLKGDIFYGINFNFNL